MKGIIHKLLFEDMADIDSRMFETYKGDEMFMDEWTKQLVEKVFVGNDSPVLRQIKELLKLSDKELYRQVRDKDITVGQFKSRCMEKLNGNQTKFIHYDDVVHMIHPDCQNLDLAKVDKWSKAAYGKPLNQLGLTGKNGTLNKELEDWQVQPKCLKSIAGFHLKSSARNRAESANVHSTVPRRSDQVEFNFQQDEVKKKKAGGVV